MKRPSAKCSRAECIKEADAPKQDKEPRPIATPQTKLGKRATNEIAAQLPSEKKSSNPTSETASKKPRTSEKPLSPEAKLPDPSKKPRVSKGAAVEDKKTFARRYCPAEGRQGREKWLALKEVFESELAPEFRFPGKYEDLRATI